MADQNSQLLAQIEIPGYQILKPLSAGKLGRSYLAEQMSLRRKVIIKTVHPAHTRGKGVADALAEEMRSIATFRHPGMAVVSDCGVVANSFCIIRDYVEGESLAKAVTSREQIDESEVLDLALQVGTTLVELEKKKLVHGNIKPSNLIFSEDGRLILTDFGFLRPLAGPEARSSASPGAQSMEERLLVLTHPNFVSPQWAQDEHLRDVRTDIYTLGMIFYCLLTGSIPYEASSKEILKMQAEVSPPPPLVQFAPGLSPEVVRLVDRMIAKSIYGRYQTAAELLDGIERARRSKQSISERLGTQPAARFSPPISSRAEIEDVKTTVPPELMDSEAESSADDAVEEQNEKPQKSDLRKRLTRKPPTPPAPQEPFQADDEEDISRTRTFPASGDEVWERSETASGVRHVLKPDDVFTIEIIDGAAKGQKVVVEEGKKVVIGRGKDCDLWLPDNRASGNHCTIVRQSGFVIAEDLESHNGTRVNARRIKQAEIFDKDLIMIGKTHIRCRVN
ncbi:MAG TPA: FHA domain-containing serine/threonine-protein kinase [Candidatus Brocadiia bacterium]|nr:FHA domain-containing serine/threonine-protein kinase [Candidatus Brocadiia bacterium]